MAHALSSGIGYGRLRGSDLVAPYHGVRVPAERPRAATPEARMVDRALEYAPRMLSGQFFTGVTAAALHGLPVDRDTDVEVGVAPPRTPPRARGVRGRQLGGIPLVLVRGLPVAEPVAAWLTCAHLPLDELVVMGDALVRRKRPLATLEQLDRAGRRYRGRHARRILRALALIRPRTDSPRETRLRLLIIRAGLPEPDVNAPIRDAHGRFLGFADLSYAEVRLIIEYEGEHHFAHPDQIRHDIDRIAAFERAGWRVIRAHRDHLREPSTLLADIRAALSARATGAELR
ncbi:MAG TPA: DUF559 domain-containing protein [Rhodoglobus sp.]|nr:DUF559 domain-containing protein [Rhodoglobus sp.]